MQIISGKTEFWLDRPSAVAIGKFDGMHRGHRALLEHIVEAKDLGLQAVLFTFDPSPAAFFSGKMQKGLTTKEEKRRLFRQMGIDVLIEFPMNASTAATPPETFIREILCSRMKTALIAAGTDLSFGDKGRGNCALLQQYAMQCGYRVEIIDKVFDAGKQISSTRVRSCVECGKMREAGRLLGVPYAVMGTVVHGNRIGRTLGFPTVNLLPPPDKLLPPNGVYRSQVECRKGVFGGLTNIGTKPTVQKGDHPVMGVETYMYDFDEDIYDTFITVRLLDFVRPEKKFDSLEALKAQNDIDGTTPYRLRANIGFGGDEGAMYLYSPVVYSAGGQFFGPNEQVTGYLSGEAAMNGLNQMNDLFARKGDYMEEGNNALAFPQGDAAFEVYGPWLINSISQEYPEFEDDYDIMPFPVYEAEDGTKGTVATPCGTWGFGVTRDADDVGAATQVIKFLTGAHASEMFFSDIGTFPTHKSVLSSMEEFTEEGPLHSLSQLLLETATPRPKMVNYPRLSVAYRDIIAFIKTQTGSQSLADYVLEKAQSVDR